jgi:hypothetical protein
MMKSRDRRIDAREVSQLRKSLEAFGEGLKRPSEQRVVPLTKGILDNSPRSSSW